MRTVVGVLRGGPSTEYEVSLKSGSGVLRHLDKEKYEPRDIFIDRTGQWHSRGVPADPEKALIGVEVVFNTLHGEYGENGRLQRMLDALGVAYTGSGPLESALAFNKHLTREEAKRLNIKVAHGVLVEPAGDIDRLATKIFRSFPLPAIVKPVTGGSSVAMTKVENFHALAPALGAAAEVSDKVLVEEFIRGREATVGVIDNFRNEKSYALMPIEIIPPASSPFFDYQAKYSGETQEIVPGRFSDKEKAQLISMAKAAHEGLGMRHYSRSDFIVSPRGIYFLEINPAAAVGLTPESLLPKALAAAGASLPHFLDHVIQLARNG